MILDNAEVWGAHKQEKLTRIRILERRNDDDRNCNVPSTTNIADEHPDKARLPSVTLTNRLHAVERSLDYKSIELVETSSAKVLGSDVKLGQCVDRRGESILAGREKKMQTNKDKKHNLPTSSPDSNFMQPTLLHSYFLLPNSSYLTLSTCSTAHVVIEPEPPPKFCGEGTLPPTPSLLTPTSLFLGKQISEQISTPSRVIQDDNEILGGDYMWTQSVDTQEEWMNKRLATQNAYGRKGHVPSRLPFIRIQPSALRSLTLPTTPLKVIDSDAVRTTAGSVVPPRNSLLPVHSPNLLDAWYLPTLPTTALLFTVRPDLDETSRPSQTNQDNNDALRGDDTWGAAR